MNPNGETWREDCRTDTGARLPRDPRNAVVFPHGGRS